MRYGVKQNRPQIISFLITFPTIKVYRVAAHGRSSLSVPILESRGIAFQWPEQRMPRTLSYNRLRTSSESMAGICCPRVDNCVDVFTVRRSILVSSIDCL